MIKECVLRKEKSVLPYHAAVQKMQEVKYLNVRGNAKTFIMLHILLNAFVMKIVGVRI